MAENNLSEKEKIDIVHEALNGNKSVKELTEEKLKKKLGSQEVKLGKSDYYDLSKTEITFCLKTLKNAEGIKKDFLKAETEDVPDKDEDAKNKATSGKVRANRAQNALAKLDLSKLNPNQLQTKLRNIEGQLRDYKGEKLKEFANQTGEFAPKK